MDGFPLTTPKIIRRLGARWWLTFLITCWGVCVLAAGFIDSWIPLTILRLLLGLFEAGCELRENARSQLPLLTDMTVFPGAIFIISAWYKTYETASRVSAFYMTALVASGFNGIVSG